MRIKREREKWADIPRFEGQYQVSNLGRVKSLQRMRKTKSNGVAVHKERILKQSTNCNGYKFLTLSRNGVRNFYLIHKLVLISFVSPAEAGMQCRHLDGNPKNNNLKNLKWGTSQENLLDKIKHGNIPKGEKHALSKLSENDVLCIRRIYRKQNKSQSQIAKMFGVTQANISSIILQKTWCNSVFS
jgi:hypothetical protein